MRLYIIITCTCILYVYIYISSIIYYYCYYMPNDVFLMICPCFYLQSITMLSRDPCRRAAKNIVAGPQLGCLLLPAAHRADGPRAVTTRVPRVARVPRGRGDMGTWGYGVLGSLKFIIVHHGSSLQKCLVSHGNMVKRSRPERQFLQGKEQTTRGHYWTTHRQV